MKLTTLAVELLAGTFLLPVDAFHQQIISPQQQNFHKEHKEPSLQDLWGSSWPYQGIQTFAHLPFSECLLNRSETFDIAVVGVPFDTAVTFRPGARFGPQGIRKSSQRQTSLRGFNFRAGINPFDDWAHIMDCGDIPVTPMDNKLALRQMTEAYENLLIGRNSTSEGEDGEILTPRLVSLGGDHSITLPALRALAQLHGNITVIHFDSHLDTWAPSKFPSFWDSDIGDFNHGSMLWMAKQENLLATDGNMHVGLRTRLSGTTYEDYDDDIDVGFERIHADDFLEIGVKGVLEQIKNYLGETEEERLARKIYISVDIDVLDPSAAPGTGTMEVGGLLSRELIYLLRGLDKYNVVGADVVEVSPPYDPLEITQLAGAQVAYELITSMVKNGPAIKTTK
ncbi:Guanidinobutyrase [Hanseniaspora valbyensis]